MDRRFFSIIITSLNPGDRLVPTLESVLEQSFGDYEIIIKDGGSRDGSLQQLERYRKDERIRLFQEKDKSIYDGMNQAVRYIQGEYVLFLNCGDYFYDTDVLRKAASLIKDRKNEDAAHKGAGLFIFYGDQYNRLQDAVVHSAPHLDDFACYRNVPCHQVCFYDSRLFAERGYDPAFRVRADYEHFLYSVYEKKAAPVYIPLIVASYEGGGFSETKENRKTSAEEHKEITRKNL